MTMTDRYARLVTFARFARWIGAEPRDAAELLQLARRAFKAGERECNTGKSADRQRDAFEAKAKELGYGVQWPGLWPTLTKGGAWVSVPSEC